MVRFRFNAGASLGVHRRLILCLVMIALVADMPLAFARKPKANQAAPAVAQPAIDRPDPEVLLVNVYRALAANQLRDALAQADVLVDAYPNFRLGHLIRGDLLLMQTRPVASLGPAGSPSDKLQNLRDEALVRFKSLRSRPDPDLVPRSVLQLRADQRHVLVVDAKRSRLYVYENSGGQLRFLTDYYVSQGKLGTNKLKAGDQKTPLGVYYITSHLEGARLPDFYGVGALPINYPNDWDRLHGRSGSGIWLHGTPSDTYSRAPLSSDGCVVLTNPDLQKLVATVEIGRTPVVISDSVEFVNKTKSASDRSQAAKLVDDWRRDVESMDATRLLTNYSGQFKNDKGEDRLTWFARQTIPNNGNKTLSVTLQDLTMFLYPGRDDLMVSTFTEVAQAGKTKSTMRKRQYWAREGTQWKIVSENMLSGMI